MLTLVHEEKSKDTVEKNRSTNHSASNVVFFSSKAKSDKKSQRNVLAAAKKLKW